MKKFKKKNDQRLYHIVTTLEKEKSPQIIYKYFGIHKRWWHYEIENLESFKERIKVGLYYYKK